MIWIRIFRTRKEAERARKILEDGGFHAEIKHDKFIDTPIEEYGVPPRFRLLIDQKDFEKVAEFLAKKLKAKQS